MRVNKIRTLTTIGAGALAAGLLMTGTAMAAPAGLPYGVAPYENVNVRAEATTDSAITGHVTAGEPRGASCWKEGQSISDHGITNNIWVRLAEGYVSAVYLKGDERGGLPVSAHC